MEFFPHLGFGWINGWILLVIEFIIQGPLLLIFPKEVVSRLFDRSGWNGKQKFFTVLGKLFSLACLFLIILSPLKPWTEVFFAGLVLYTLGIAGLVMAMLDFKNTPINQPATRGIYRYSRHPQIVSLFFVFLGVSLAIGSWSALIALLFSKLFQHFGILAEEEVCIKRYGEPYLAFMKKVPRYLLFF